MSLMSSPDGKSVLTNSSDRVIRAYSLERLLSGERPQPRELQDVVNRVQWAHAGFSSESEHVNPATRERAPLLLSIAGSGLAPPLLHHVSGCFPLA